LILCEGFGCKGENSSEDKKQNRQKKCKWPAKLHRVSGYEKGTMEERGRAVSYHLEEPLL